ncbi:hypothetical protein ACFQ11_04210 [Actinomadura sediminis]|uniref:Major facilitator superfamily (MFS) profile domain-containing protein n=2 Tax=Actinomadura sediminis TaxID=1038904 RepID=A0ABW3EJG2_9ACTN
MPRSSSRTSNRAVAAAVGLGSVLFVVVYTVLTGLASVMGSGAAAADLLPLVNVLISAAAGAVAAAPLFLVRSAAAGAFAAAAAALFGYLFVGVVGLVGIALIGERSPAQNLEKYFGEVSLMTVLGMVACVPAACLAAGAVGLFRAKTAEPR